MRCLNRNKVTFHYATYSERVPVIIEDEYGNQIDTGEYRVAYNTPQQAVGNISPARGVVATKMFGDSEEYDRVLVVDNPDTPIDEYSVLWVDTIDTEQPYDYIVRRVARSLNSAIIALAKVNVR